MKLLFQTIICQVILFYSATTLTAQQIESLPPRQPSEFVNARPEYCWREEQKLSDVIQSTPADETIIVIGRLGDKDSKPNLNKRRLYNIRAYATLEGWSNKRKPETIILAEGEPVKGLGQIEFYVRGQLVEALKIPSNGVFNPVGCYAGADGEPYCEREVMKLFYPCKEEVEKRKQKRKVFSKKKKS